MLTDKQKAWDKYKAAQRAERAKPPTPQPDGPDVKPAAPVFGRAARRAAMRGRGDRDQFRRSRIQRLTRKRRTGGVK